MKYYRTYTNIKKSLHYHIGMSDYHDTVMPHTMHWTRYMMNIVHGHVTVFVNTNVALTRNNCIRLVTNIMYLGQVRPFVQRRFIQCIQLTHIALLLYR
jgi:hypothetical protein